MEASIQTADMALLTRVDSRCPGLDADEVAEVDPRHVYALRFWARAEAPDDLALVVAFRTNDRPRPILYCICASGPEHAADTEWVLNDDPETVADLMRAMGSGQDSRLTQGLRDMCADLLWTFVAEVEEGRHRPGQLMLWSCLAEGAA